MSSACSAARQPRGSPLIASSFPCLASSRRESLFLSERKYLPANTVTPPFVHSVSFIAWKDEAFAIGRQWAALYEEGSESRKLLDGMMDTFYLVNGLSFAPLLSPAS